MVNQAETNRLNIVRRHTHQLKSATNLFKRVVTDCLILKTTPVEVKYIPNGLLSSAFAIKIKWKCDYLTG